MCFMIAELDLSLDVRWTVETNLLPYTCSESLVSAVSPIKRCANKNENTISSCSHFYWHQHNMFFHFLFLPYYYYFHMDRKIPRKEAFLSSVDGGENEGCQARAACDVMTTAGGTAATRPPPHAAPVLRPLLPFLRDR